MVERHRFLDFISHGLLVLGVLVNYLDTPVGNGWLIFMGVALITVAIILNAMAYRQTGSSRGMSTKGLVLSVLSGCLMGLFYRYVAAAMAQIEVAQGAVDDTQRDTALKQARAGLTRANTRACKPLYQGACPCWPSCCLRSLPRSPPARPIFWC